MMKYIRLFSLIFGIFLLFFYRVSSVKAVDCSDTDANGDRYTLSESCSFPGALLDGVDANGASSTNSAILTVTSGVTLTVPAQQTFATGIIDLKGGGSIVIVKNGQIKLKTPIYMTDSDDDHTPASTSATLIPNAADKRKYTITRPTTSDCNDITANGGANVWSATTCSPDLDGDSYTSSVQKTCTDNTTCSSVAYAGTGSNNDVSSYTVGTLKTPHETPSGPDCNDSPTATTANADKVYQLATCYVDTDNDNYGSATSKACVGNASYTSYTSDYYSCSNSTYGSAATNGSAVTANNFSSINTDCWDGHASYNYSCAPLVYGDGRDGQDLSYVDADYAPGITTSAVLTSAGSSSIITASNISGLAQGDIVLIANLQRVSGTSGNVGKYEFKLVNSINTDTKTITFFTDLSYAYDGTTQKIIVQKIPQYTNITVSGTITPTAWGGTSGGIFAIKATGTISVPASTSIDASSIGYRGGDRADYGVGYGGESFCGSATSNGGGSTTINGVCGGGGGGLAAASGNAGGTGSATGGAGGGGGLAGQFTTIYMGGGAGGGYGSAGLGGKGGNNGSNGSTDSSGNGGDGLYTQDSSTRGGGGGGGGTYGSSTLDTLFFGSGGAEGGSPTGALVRTPGAGGNGGGIIYLAGSTVSIGGTIKTNGADGGLGTTRTDLSLRSGSGGGGSGGSILILGNTVTLGTSLVTSTGGLGGDGSGYDGGYGGNGRIAIGGLSLTGTTNPTYTALGDIVSTPTPQATPTIVLTSTPTPTSTPVPPTPTHTPTPTITPTPSGGCWAISNVCDGGCNSNSVALSCGFSFPNGTACSVNGTGSCYKSTGTPQIMCYYDSLGNCSECSDLGFGSNVVNDGTACTWKP